MKDLEGLFDNNKKPTFKYNKRKTRRTIVKTDGVISSEAIEAEVISITGTTILVKSVIGVIYECVTGGIVISNNDNQSLVAVGDVVFIISDSSSDQSGTVVKVKERRNHFSRKEVGYQKEDVIAANIDNLVILMSLKNPEYNKRLIDRFLVTAELNGIKPIMCLNKIDLIDIPEISKDFEAYKHLGIDMFYISAKFKQGIEPIIEILKGSTSVITGPSGSGKSTLMNTLLGSEYQAIQESSQKTTKGRHTTSAVKMFELPEGGKLIDTPGVREFGIWGMEKDELALYFHEFDEFNKDCKYYPCTHTHEPGCAVIEAVEKGDIDFDRYESYNYLYETLD